MVIPISLLISARNVYWFDAYRPMGIAGLLVDTGITNGYGTHRSIGMYV
jgi:hypothetical protein